MTGAGLAGGLRALRRETLAVMLAARDPRTPRTARWLAAAVVAYALSPIDLIPDVIPVLGHLDDLLLVPAGIWLVLRLIPPEVMADARRAAASAAPPRPSLRGAVMVGVLWLMALVLAGWWLAWPS